MDASDLRLKIREGKLDRPTSGLAPGLVQANLIALPKDVAFDFLLFATRNPKPCPILDVLEPGHFESALAKGSDIRSDIARYRLYEQGELKEELKDVRDIYKNDLYGFLVGCSFSFEQALISQNIELRHVKECKNVAMYKTSIPCASAGLFKSNMVVSMRPIKCKEVAKAIEISSSFPSVHGGPVHVGSPELIGIHDINKPDYGEAVEIKDDELPVFWACGVTPQLAVLSSKIDFAITHAPGFMFLTDVKDEAYRI